MTEPIAFTLAVFALLAAPGPTNTLLATSSAAAGWRRSLPLIVAMVVGYLASTIAIAVVVAPLVRASGTLDIALRAACGVYLAYAAWRLWQESGGALHGEPVKFRRVLVATLLNPKSIIFAYVLVPHLPEGRYSEALPYLGGMSLLAVLVGLLWVGVGALMHARGNANVGQQGLVRRAGAGILCLFAMLVAGSAFTV